jgi:hypothetical protein
MTRMLRLVLVLSLACIGCLVAAPSASAQTQTWTLQVFQVGVSPTTGTAFFVLPLPTAAVTCNATQTLPVTPTTPPVNPKTLYWTQAELPGQVCKGDLSGQSGFVSLPAGGPYPFAMTFTNEVSTSAAGVGADPFRRVDPATVPANVVIK